MAVRSPIPAPPRSKLTQNRRPRPRRHLLRRDGAIRTPPPPPRPLPRANAAGRPDPHGLDRPPHPAVQPGDGLGRARAGSRPRPPRPQGRRAAPPGLVQTYAGHAHAVLALAVAADNARFASGGGDRAVLAWDVAGASVVRRLEGHGARVNDVAWGGDGVIVSGELSPPRRRMERREGWREGRG